MAFGLENQKLNSIIMDNVGQMLVLHYIRYIMLCLLVGAGVGAGVVVVVVVGAAVTHVSTCTASMMVLSAWKSASVQ